MKFVFWQNVVSIHQSAFIKALAENNEVVLVAAEELDSERRNEKWTVPSMGNAGVIIAPDVSKIKKLLDEPETSHVFSGINGYPMVYRAFKMAMKRGLKVSVMAEPYEWAGLKGWLRRQMYRWLFIRYGKNISHLFATGNMGVECYVKSGFPKDKIHQWGYFTEMSDLAPQSYQDRALPNLIFIGKIDERKNILDLVRSAILLKDSFNRFEIIGTGPLEKELRDMISDTPNIKYIGAVANKNIAGHLIDADLLILPSLFDGWGAVVNEALQQGTRVLCSDRCGAKVLLDGEIRGGTFPLGKENGLSDGLRHWISKGPLTIDAREKIASWARENISGTSAALYFHEVIKGEDPQIKHLRNYSAIGERNEKPDYHHPRLSLINPIV